MGVPPTLADALPVTKVGPNGNEEFLVGLVIATFGCIASPGVLWVLLVPEVTFEEFIN